MDGEVWWVGKIPKVMRTDWSWVCWLHVWGQTCLSMMDDRNRLAWLVVWIYKGRHGWESPAHNKHWFWETDNACEITVLSPPTTHSLTSRTERKLHNNDCSTLPEDSACTTTIHLSWLTLYREFRVGGCSSRQKAYCAPHPPNCMHLLIPSVIYGIVCRAIMQNTAASLR